MKKPYADLLAQEAETWNRAAEDHASTVPPDWSHHRALRPNAIVHTTHVDSLLRHVRPGMRVLELGCGSGWLTLAMAERGAYVLGIDIADRAIALARSHYESVRPAVRGVAAYDVVDINHIDLPAEAYDVVVAYGILHHLIEPARLIEEVHKALRPGGLFWVSDVERHETPETVFLAGLLAFMLPTYVSYGTKIRVLLRFGTRAPGRVRASMESECLSPFEGVGRGRNWLEAVRQRFTLEDLQAHPAVTGYLAALVKLPDSFALPLLRSLLALDTWLVRWNLLRSSSFTLYARKPEAVPSSP